MTRIEGDFLSSPGLQRLLSLLTDAGHQALIVGGAVRNALLGDDVSDVDLSTDALPGRVAELAKSAGMKAVPTGIDHGTVTIITPDSDRWRSFEVTTFRRDVETDGRFAVVSFSTDIADDARRRDFTMNALYATADGRVLDPIGGLPDLMARRLRFVGDARARIAEDYLRILRFFRFHAWYGAAGAADPEAVAACAELAHGLDRISKERIGDEMRKLLSAPAPGDALHLMDVTGVLQHILPGAKIEVLDSLLKIEDLPDWVLRLATLQADDPRQSMRLSNDTNENILHLQRLVARDDDLERIAYTCDKQLARQLALYRLALGRDVPTDWNHQIDHAHSQKLPISAADLMPAMTGPALGIALRAADEHWIETGFQANRDELLAVARAAGRQAGAEQ
ncbi:CCA tRNA nucleotidyltransferase [Paracoccus sp. 11-3]|uniref:CCA tRNA nucleotidyltransferase n=1 Tax=Paracoccus amoyensis TaxID=2760093 RepID=A0A926GBC5_9RHOB|nr:CCA tRNA nucleotidyltransferase [Paracoccus amoyensis]MBC9247893.1 CCA tRNA nucleotidyltransferase [Paracoccus amoyensis]